MTHCIGSTLIAPIVLTLLLGSALGGCSSDDGDPDPAGSVATPGSGPTSGPTSSPTSGPTSSAPATPDCPAPDPVLIVESSHRQVGYLARFSLVGGSSISPYSAGRVTDVRSRVFARSGRVDSTERRAVLRAAGAIALPREVTSEEAIRGVGRGNLIYAAYASITVVRGTWTATPCDQSPRAVSGRFVAVTAVGPARNVVCRDAVRPDPLDRAALQKIDCDAVSTLPE